MTRERLSINPTSEFQSEEEKIGNRNYFGLNPASGLKKRKKKQENQINVQQEKYRRELKESQKYATNLLC